jgi:hypothetical protein
VVMEVSDTGVGMDAQTQAHLFEPFSRPRNRARARALVSPRSTASSNRAADSFPCRASRTTGPRSGCSCRDCPTRRWPKRSQTAR